MYEAAVMNPKCYKSAKLKSGLLAMSKQLLLADARADKWMMSNLSDAQRDKDGCSLKVRD